MITRENVKQVLEEITKEEVDKANELYHEYFLIELSCSNTCHWVNMTNLEYNEETEREANDNGQLFCGWDTVLQLVDELGIEGKPINLLYS